MGGWSTLDVPDLTGRTAAVTGANSGIGLVCARELARKGATVVMGCRDPQRGENALAEMREAASGVTVELERLDLADLASVREFAAAVCERHPKLDLLINNAGVMATPRAETKDGFELQIGTNHLGHFALTGLLFDRLTAAREARVVTVSSGAHRLGRIDFDDLMGERSYSRWGRYSQSKLANLLFAFELARRAAKADLALISAAAHPGYAATHLQSSGPGLGGGLVSLFNTTIGRLGNVLIAQSDEMGAQPSLYAATVEAMPSGGFVGPSGPGELRGRPKLVSPARAARDEAIAARLWDVSEALTGVEYL